MDTVTDAPTVLVIRSQVALRRMVRVALGSRTGFADLKIGLVNDEVRIPLATTRETFDATIFEGSQHDHIRTNTTGSPSAVFVPSYTS